MSETTYTLLHHISGSRRVAESSQGHKQTDEYVGCPLELLFKGYWILTSEFLKLCTVTGFLCSGSKISAHRGPFLIGSLDKGLEIF